MFITSLPKFHSSWHLSAAFQSNVSCFSAGTPDLDITCTDLVAFTEFSASLTAIIAALSASMAVCVIAYNISCLAAISLLYCLCLNLPHISITYFMHVSLPYVRLVSSYFSVCLA